MYEKDNRLAGSEISTEEKSRIHVDIFGMQYKLVSNSSPHYMKRVAELVDDRMKKVARLHPRLDSQRIAVLAAVQVADELLRQQQELQAASTQATAGLRELETERDRLAKQLEEAAAREREQLAEASAREREHLAQLAELENSRKTLQQQAEQLQYRKRELAEQFELLEQQSQETSSQYVELQGKYAELERNHAESSQHAHIESEFEALQRRCAELEVELEAARKEGQLQLPIVEEKDDQHEWAVKYSELLEEYEKLKAEYNEWIDILENNSGAAGAKHGA